MPPEKPKCCASISSGFGSYRCNNPGKVERNGKLYCGTHDPVRLKEKRDKARTEAEARHEQWKIAMARNRAVVDSERAILSYVTSLQGPAFNALPVSIQLACTMILTEGEQ